MEIINRNNSNVLRGPTETVDLFQIANAKLVASKDLHHWSVCAEIVIKIVVVRQVHILHYFLYDIKTL
jgi:hypothetical protein